MLIKNLKTSHIQNISGILPAQAIIFAPGKGAAVISHPLLHRFQAICAGYGSTLSRSTNCRGYYRCPGTCSGNFERPAGKRG